MNYTINNIDLKHLIRMRKSFVEILVDGETLESDAPLFDGDCIVIPPTIIELLVHYKHAGGWCRWCHNNAHRGKSKSDCINMFATIKNRITDYRITRHIGDIECEITNRAYVHRVNAGLVEEHAFG